MLGRERSMNGHKDEREGEVVRCATPTRTDILSPGLADSVSTKSNMKQ